MSDKDKIIPYLSDDELDKLITDIEGKELVQAPAGIERNVLSFIEYKRRRKTIEFGKYCVRVGFAVAAAIALVCIVPFIPDTQTQIPSREDTVSERNVVSREEVLEKRFLQSKEEVLRERASSGYLEETEFFIQSHIESLFK
ncbi:hypothetical protein [Butyrivibrio sp. XPD2006]|uniref:hypothetical protein n=1 Tax=Butyrivibrio sp. XPD2006 TaxID=1280668 RepID=UPI0003B3042F|nr:hypothetical protein [Butyrivibrio sp. XPD2006]